MTDKFQNDIKNLVEEFKFNGQKKFKLIVLFGLLGDFDSFEYAINLKNFIDNHQDKNLDIFAIAIGNQNGKQKFCKFTGFPEESLIAVSDNQIHNDLKVSGGLDIGLGGWINMLLMLSGINSFKTILLLNQLKNLRDPSCLRNIQVHLLKKIYKELDFCCSIK